MCSITPDIREICSLFLIKTYFLSVYHRVVETSVNNGDLVSRSSFKWFPFIDIFSFAAPLSIGGLHYMDDSTPTHTHICFLRWETEVSSQYSTLPTPSPKNLLNFTPKKKENESNFFSFFSLFCCGSSFMQQTVNSDLIGMWRLRSVQKGCKSVLLCQWHSAN